MTIEYLPSEEMVAGFLTKPLQGEMFRRFRNKILGVESERCNRSMKNDEKEKMRRLWAAESYVVAQRPSESDRKVNVEMRLALIFVRIFPETVN